MIILHRKFRAYRAYFRSSVIAALQYRISIFGTLALTVIWVLVLSGVWTSVFRSRPSLNGFDADTIIVYITLASLQATVIDSALIYIIASRIRTGEVIFDLSRPLSFPGQALTMQAAHSLVHLACAFVAAPFAALAGGLGVPSTPTAGFYYVIALVLGWILNGIIALIIGLTAFWTVDNLGIATLFRLVAGFLAGTSVPLDFFPDFLRSAAEALPFRFIVYEPAAIYVGKIQGDAIATSLLVAGGWIVGLLVILSMVWRRAYRRTVVHGG